jgi:hypothetical protein
MNCLFNVLATLAVISFSTPIFIAVIVPIAILYFSAQVRSVTRCLLCSGILVSCDLSSHFGSSVSMWRLFVNSAVSSPSPALRSTPTFQKHWPEWPQSEPTLSRIGSWRSPRREWIRTKSATSPPPWRVGRALYDYGPFLLFQSLTSLSISLQISGSLSRAHWEHRHFLRSCFCGDFGECAESWARGSLHFIFTPNHTGTQLVGQNDFGCGDESDLGRKVERVRGGGPGKGQALQFPNYIVRAY